ncbi:DUF3558 domain-containing protein [Streptomyces diastatochromogenes]|nr:DUF3558 domain-containing protein [Streptomyces diastatochromogenes]
MQRKRYAPGRTGSTARTAVALALGLGLGPASPPVPPAPRPTTSPSTPRRARPPPLAPPGRYRTLFEPCGAVPQATLKDLLPGAATLPDAERDKAYRGVAAVTYDTDRRVGCTWKADTPDTSDRLSLDIERVVSYDAAVSDDDRAQEVYARKQLAAGIPLPPTASPTPGTPTGAPSASGKPPRPPPRRGSRRRPAPAPGPAPAPPPPVPAPIPAPTRAVWSPVFSTASGTSRMWTTCSARWVRTVISVP